MVYKKVSSWGFRSPLVTGVAIAHGAMNSFRINLTYVLSDLNPPPQKMSFPTPPRKSPETGYSGKNRENWEFRPKPRKLGIPAETEKKCRKVKKVRKVPKSEKSAEKCRKVKKVPKSAEK